MPSSQKNRALNGPDALPAAGRLLEEARQRLPFAHAPYSNFRVVAAVVDEQGRIFTGVNVENASYGLTMCAERVAIFTAIANGARRIRALAVASTSSTAVSPCGACRQVMAEFCDSAAPVYWVGEDDRIMSSTLSELLPAAFTADNLNAKPR
jgi:cytidine deaminase